MKSQIIQNKASLKRFYDDIYKRFVMTVDATNVAGYILEIGSGSGFAKDYLPQLITSDITEGPGIDRIIDARKINFQSDSCKSILLWDSFHHISDIRQFFSEADRILKVGGRLLIIDPYMGILSSFIYKYIHHESCNMNASEWAFKSDDPEMDANIALSWIVFERDLNIFSREFPHFRILKKETHSLLRYWLSGGLKWWNLIPFGLDHIVKATDEFLVKHNPDLASFWTIEIEKIS